MASVGNTLSLSPEQLRAITTIGAIGAAQSAGSLSRLTGVQVQVQTPELVLASPVEVPRILGGMEAPAFGVLVPFTGDLEGNTVILFQEDGMAALETLLFPHDGVADEMRQSAFTEIGNILAGAFLTVLSRLSSRVLISQPPLLVRDMAGAILDGILAELDAGSTKVLVLLSRLCDTEGRSLVRTMILPDPGGTDLLIEAAGRLMPAP